jgi:hypothetical protein
MRSKAGLCTAIRQHRCAALVVNTRSRRGRRLYPAVAARLQAAGFNLLGSFPAGRPGELGASLATAIDLQPDLLVVGGGDGSISEAARRLAYRDMALGILPLGLRLVSNNRTASGVSEPTRAELPPPTVPMRVASVRGSARFEASGGVGIGGDLGGGLFAELDVPAEAGEVPSTAKCWRAECRSWWSVQPFLCGS